MTYLWSSFVLAIFVFGSTANAAISPKQQEAYAAQQREPFTEIVITTLMLGFASHAFKTLTKD